MADNIGNIDAKEYYLGVDGVENKSFHVKGAEHLDWGMKNRLAKIFNEKSGNTVMLAFDHGYIMGPTSGLERLDIVIPPLIEHVDCIMATRGSIRSCISPNIDKAICLRIGYDSSVLYDDMSNGGGVACNIENAIRMNATCLAAQTFIGSSGEKNSLELLAKTVDAGVKYSIPTLGVVAVGKEMERTTKFFQLATRILAENGANIVKSYYCDDFEKVVAACPVPIVIAGGKKLPEAEALTMAYRAISEGARGVDMGRNIFQSEHPEAMCGAIGKVVHENFTDKEAYEFFLDIANSKNE
ncbi:MAG: 3-hydroxy-5-phosphonooxypentane-2,4-dione thiolase [Tissierellia bacterium]|nr:3-hydroxy-5-phosphonooxypentane-2,4-dione thiolase [Tissierellia bacterium]